MSRDPNERSRLYKLREKLTRDIIELDAKIKMGGGSSRFGHLYNLFFLPFPLFLVQISHSSAVQVRSFFRGSTGRFELLCLFKATTKLRLVRKQK